MGKKKISVNPKSDKSRKQKPSGKDARQKQPKQLFWLIINGIQMAIYMGLITIVFMMHHRIDRLQAAIKENKDQQTATNERNQEKTEKSLLDKISKQPEDIQAHQELGKYYQNQGRGQEAIETYRQALKIAPDNEEINFALGCLLLNYSEYQQEAVQHLRKVLALNPNHGKKAIIQAWIKSIAKTAEKRE